MRVQPALQTGGRQVMVRQGGAQQGGGRQVFMVNESGEVQEAVGGAAQSGQGGGRNHQGNEQRFRKKLRVGIEKGGPWDCFLPRSMGSTMAER